MTSFDFKKPTPTEGFATPTKVRLLQSATFAGAYVQTGIDQLLEDGIELDSSLNIVGARYRITAQSAIDFTTIGAIDSNVGTEFVATGQLLMTADDKLLPLGLEDNPEDATEYIVTESLALDTKFTRLQLVTAAGVTGDSAVLEPKIATPDSFQIFAYSKDAGLGVVAGIILDVTPLGGIATAGDNTIISRAEDASDAAGRASIDAVPADSGKYNVNFGGKRKIIDSTDRGGTSINWKDLPF